MKKIVIVFKKELKDILRDRRTIIFMVAIPLLVFPVLISIASGMIMSKAKEAQEKTLQIGILTYGSASGFRQMLLDKRRELVGDMTGIEAEAFGADRAEAKGDISDHPADAGTDNFEQEFSLGLLESERMLLGEIDEALRRIEEGTYGICQGTGQPISKARLTARPWAPYGIEYARMVEKGLVRPGERIDEAED